MATHDIGTSTVSSIAVANAGDLVWLYESEMGLHDADGKYLGRGVWRLRKISDETRVSLIVDGEKFDRANGRARPRNGFTSGNLIAGEAEKADILWLSENKYRLIRHLEHCSAQTLRKVAEVAGWDGGG